MYSRRSFLEGLSALALAQILAGCSNPKTSLRVLLLEKSIPPQLINEFRDSIPEKVIFKPEPQLKNFLSLLETWQEKDPSKNEENSWLPWSNKKTTPIADLVTLGDAWLADAIAQNLLSPLDINQLSTWENIPPRWQEIVKRNEQGMIDENGKIYGAPYRWGTTIIAYQEDKFKKLGWTPTDWKDLWREELQNRISLLNQPREVIGLTLKKLGYSYNSLNISEVPNLKSELIALNKQTKFYSSDHYLEPLILGDTWLAVGWSNEIIPLLNRYPTIKAIVPESGTALWADVWVKPAMQQNPSNLIKDWINFCWQPSLAQRISLYTNAVSPMIVNEKPEQLAKPIRYNPLRFIEPKILEKSEFIKPLPKKIEQQYQDLWKEIRISVRS